MTMSPVADHRLFKSRMKQFRRCVRNLRSFTDNQAQITSWNEDTLEEIVIQFHPNDGPYKGGKFNFEIKLEEGYPVDAPMVSCLTPIYHPNIDSTDTEYNVCLSLLDEWTESCTLEDLIQGLLFLLYNPNKDDALNPLLETSITEEEFLVNIQKSLQGEAVGDDDEFSYPLNLSVLESEDQFAEVQQNVEATLQQVDMSITTKNLQDVNIDADDDVLEMCEEISNKEDDADDGEDDEKDDGEADEGENDIITVEESEGAIGPDVYFGAIDKDPRPTREETVSALLSRQNSKVDKGSVICEDSTGHVGPNCEMKDRTLNWSEFVNARTLTVWDIDHSKFFLLCVQGLHLAFTRKV